MRTQDAGTAELEHVETFDSVDRSKSAYRRELCGVVLDVGRRRHVDESRLLDATVANCRPPGV